MKAPQTKKCIICGSTFTRKPKQYPNVFARKKTCGLSCRLESTRKPIRIGIIREGGLTLEEIAMVADLDISGISDILKKALEKLRRQLE